jgi:hypothetical protein
MGEVESTKSRLGDLRAGQWPRQRPANDKLGDEPELINSDRTAPAGWWRSEDPETLEDAPGRPGYAELTGTE